VIHRDIDGSSLSIAFYTWRNPREMTCPMETYIKDRLNLTVTRYE
jgi:hypothetical protein